MADARNATDLLLDHLKGWGVRAVFTVPGAHVDPLILAIIQDGSIHVVIAAHEQGAGYMADGYARMSGCTAVTLSNSGPGATNLATAAVTARLDHVPVVFLTGDTPSMVDGLGAFQCGADSVTGSTALLRAAAGQSYRVSCRAHLHRTLREIEQRVSAGLPAPCHLCIPIDVALGLAAEPPEPDAGPRDGADWSSADGAVHSDPDLPVPRGPKALFLVGEQMHAPRHMERLGEIAAKFHIPVACSLAAKQVLAHVPEQLRLGCFGYAGSPRAFHAILESGPDVAHAVGIDLDERNSAGWHPALLEGDVQLIRWTCGDRSRGSRAEPLTHVSARDPDHILQMLAACCTAEPTSSPQSRDARASWTESVLAQPLEPPADMDAHDGKDGRMGMAKLVRVLRGALQRNTVLFLDSGDHRIYAGHYWQPEREGRFFTSACSAPMGWAICAAVGAAFVDNTTPKWVLTGDGCMLMHGIELSTAARYGRNVKVLVSNNGSHGRIAARLRNQPVGVRKALSSIAEVSWTDFAASIGVRAVRAEGEAQFRKAIAVAESIDGPFLIETMTTIDDVPPFPQSVFSACAPSFMESWKRRVTRSGRP